MHPCCSRGDPPPPAATAATAPSTSRRSWPRRLGAVFEWTVPLATLALIPKCPACVAAYVLLFTGIGLSLPAATATRWTLVALSIAALAYLLLRAARRALSPAA